VYFSQDRFILRFTGAGNLFDFPILLTRSEIVNEKNNNFLKKRSRVI
jgi:hypothetical protein